MTVITSTHDPYSNQDAECYFCELKIYRPPYVHWFAGPKGDTYICPDCCRGLLTGLVADMVHAVAIQDLQRLRYGHTLVRKDITENDRDVRAEWSAVLNPLSAKVKAKAE